MEKKQMEYDLINDRKLVFKVSREIDPELLEFDS